MDRRKFLKLAAFITAFTAIFSRLPGIDIFKKRDNKNSKLTGLKKARFFKKL
jgi:hypothetical protein